MAKERLETTANQPIKQSPFKKLNRKLQSALNSFYRKFESHPKVSDIVYLNTTNQMIGRNPRYHTTYPEVVTFRSLEHYATIDFRSNSYPKKATDLLVILGQYTYRPAKYVIATLEWGLQQDENELSLSFKQIRRNWRANLFSDSNSEERDKKHPCIGYRWAHYGTVLWAYDGTVLSSLMNAWNYIAVAKKDAIKVAKAYSLVANHCETYKVGNAEMFRIIARAFMRVGKHRIKMPPLSDEEEANRKIFRELNRSSSDDWSDRLLGTTYADSLLNLERAEKITPPQLAAIFLETLNTFEPFKESRITEIEPRSLYIAPKVYKA